MKGNKSTTNRKERESMKRKQNRNDKKTANVTIESKHKEGEWGKWNTNETMNRNELNHGIKLMRI